MKRAEEGMDCFLEGSFLNFLGAVWEGDSYWLTSWRGAGFVCVLLMM